MSLSLLTAVPAEIVIGSIAVFLIGDLQFRYRQNGYDFLGPAISCMLIPYSRFAHFWSRFGKMINISA
jgi:hypothetical protein